MSEPILPALSSAEQTLMDLIWLKQPVTVAELLLHVNAGRENPIMRNTLQTQLARLERKGWLAREGELGALRYRSNVAEEKGRRSLLLELKKRLFGGSTVSMVRCLVEESGITGKEIEELRAMLNSKGKGKGK
ncbi:MAG: BlaI/MecI/CopY family transcriptional regulator [Akkermansiaceae bacterium]|nr:BlaI/MecI/CopY family transcriptional regulator [Akkermansiaceae bacterium]